MAKHKPIKIVLDTNWFVSATINRSSRRKLYNILINPEIEVYYCDELLIEYKNVISRKKFSQIITIKQASRFVKAVTKILHKVVVIEKSTIVSRDKKDNYLLGLSEACKAHYLITGDDDLLVLKKYLSTKIISLADFIAIIKKTKNE